VFQKRKNPFEPDNPKKGRATAGKDFDGRKERNHPQPAPQCPLPGRRSPFRILILLEDTQSRNFKANVPSSQRLGGCEQESGNEVCQIHMESVYIETTVISYLSSRPSRDLLVAAHQQVTYDWWTSRRENFDCFVSQIVIDEVSAGDPEEARKRIEIVDMFPVLEVTGEAELLAKAILGSEAIPSRAVRDAAHIAVAAVHGIDYLLTWNCTHLANAQVIRRISAVCNREGFHMPIICTPEELMGG
jgi:predicted nucleic acid-binding protein